MHRLVFERGDLPGATGDVGESTETLVLPEVSKADPDVAEHAAHQLALAAWQVCRVQGTD